MRDVSISSFFYLELWLRPDGTLKLSESCCRSCAGRLQVPCQPGLHCKFLNQKGRLLQRAEECPHLVEGRCPHAGTCRITSSVEEESATIGHDAGASKKEEVQDRRRILQTLCSRGCCLRADGKPECEGTCCDQKLRMISGLPVPRVQPRFPSLPLRSLFLIINCG